MPRASWALCATISKFGEVSVIARISPARCEDISVTLKRTSTGRSRSLKFESSGTIGDALRLAKSREAMMVTWGEDSFSTTSSEPLRNRGDKVSCNERGACATFHISTMIQQSTNPHTASAPRYLLTLPKSHRRPTHTSTHLQHTRLYHT